MLTLALSLLLAAEPQADCYSTLRCNAECKDGNQQACYLLAKLKWVGPEAELDVKAAKELFAQACGQGVWPACIELKRRRSGKEPHNSVPQIQEERARPAACEHDWLDACPDRAKALVRLEARCKERHPRACEELARVSTSKERAFELLQQACEMGALRSCAMVANNLMIGNGAPKDVEKGFALFEKACDAGLAEACWQLSNHFRSSVKPEEKAKVDPLLSKACLLEHFAACKQQAFLSKQPGRR